MATTSLIGGLSQMAGANQGGPVLDLVDDLLAATNRNAVLTNEPFPHVPEPPFVEHASARTSKKEQRGADEAPADSRDGERVADALRALFAQVDKTAGADPTWVECEDLAALSEAQRTSLTRSFKRFGAEQRWTENAYRMFMQEARRALVLANARGDSRCLAWMARDDGQNNPLELSATDRAAAHRIYGGSISQKHFSTSQGEYGDEPGFIAEMRKGVAVALHARDTPERTSWPSDAQRGGAARRGAQAKTTAVRTHTAPSAPLAVEATPQAPRAAPEKTVPELADLAASQRQAKQRAAPAPQRAPREARTQFDTFAALSTAAQRLKTLALETAAARVRDTQKHKEQKLPVQEPEPHHREILHDASAPGGREGVSSHYRPTLTSLDRKVAQIRDDIVNNPMWINSAFLTRGGTKRDSTNFMSDKEALLENGDLRKAKALAAQHKAQHDKDLKTSQRELRKLEAFQRQPSWLRWAQNQVFDRENVLTKAAEQAAEREHTSQAELVHVKQLGTELYAAHNALKAEEERPRYERALARRHEIEQPLREALLERYIAEQAVISKELPLRVRDALDGEKMSLQSIETFGDLTRVAVFRTESQHSLLVDMQEHRQELGKLAIGDVVTVGKNEFGARQLAVTARSDAWARDERVEGRMSAIRREGTKLTGVEVEDARGVRKWLVPERGDDLNVELGHGRAALATLEVGDTMRLGAGRGERALHVTSSSRGPSRGR